MKPETTWKEKTAVILTPLISQIFHGDNSTSEKIHEELDKALDSFDSLLSSSQALARREGYYEGEKNEFQNQAGARMQAWEEGVREAMRVVKEALVNSLSGSECMSCIIAT